MVRLVAALLAIAASLLPATSEAFAWESVSAAPAMESSLETPADDEPPAPSDTVTEFFPESANLSDCVGLVEKPGCGSGSRGGWHQTLVFIALFGGLGVILWRVARGISANRAEVDAGVESDPERS